MFFLQAQKQKKYRRQRFEHSLNLEGLSNKTTSITLSYVDTLQKQ